MTNPPPDDRAVPTATLVALYALAEKRILAGVTQILSKTLPTLEGRQAALPRIRRLIRRELGILVSRSNPLVQRMITAAVNDGARAALEQFAAAAGGGVPPEGRVPSPFDSADDFDFSMPHGERSAQAIRNDIVSELEDVRFRLTRLPDDVYKAIAPHGGIGNVLDNNFTPAQAQAVAWRVFVSQGVTGFTDVSGRDWSLSAYTEMAVRTAAMRAYNASHLARMHALGIHYFTVPTSLHPCPKCFPWQSKVLTDGYVADPVIPVDGTIAEATIAGLFHPNCEHTLIPVFPGITVLEDPGVWDDAKALEYKNSQKQRRLELEVRKARRELEHAIDPTVRKSAKVDFLEAQRRVRVFVRENNLTRQYRREQTNLTDHYIKLPTPIR